MVKFPSLEFFQALRDGLNANTERLRRLGTADVTLVVKVDYADQAQCYEIVLGGYHCLSVRTLASIDAAGEGAVTVEGPYEVWREMIDSIQRSGQADLDHTLNTLTLMDTPLHVSALNQLDTDLFYRYQQTLQEFFDGAASLTAGAQPVARAPGTSP